MKELVSNLKLFKFLIGIWFAAVLFGSIMFTISLMYDIKLTIIISCLIGVISLLGIIYTGYGIIKIKNSIKYFEQKMVKN